MSFQSSGLLEALMETHAVWPVFLREALPLSPSSA